MNLYKYTYQGETYEFRMPNKARIAIEEIQNNALKGLSDPDVARAALAAFKVGNEQNCVYLSGPGSPGCRDGKGFL